MKKEKMFIRSISVRKCGGYTGTRLGISILFQKERFPDSTYQPNLILSPQGDTLNTELLNESKFIDILNRLTRISPNKTLEGLKEQEVQCVISEKQVLSFEFLGEVFTDDELSIS